MARYADPRDKVTKALNDYFSLRAANPYALMAAVSNAPEVVQEGMVIFAQDFIFSVAEKGKEGEYAPGSTMEKNSIAIREMLGDF